MIEAKLINSDGTSETIELERPALAVVKPRLNANDSGFRDVRYEYAGQLIDWRQWPRVAFVGVYQEARP